MAGKIGKIAAVLLALLLVVPAYAMDAESIKEKYMRDKARLHSKHFGIVINEDTFDEAKEWLLASCDLAVASLTSIREKIENSNVTYPEVEELIDEINEHISDISAVREDIESAQTVEELKEAGRELKKEWMEAKVSLKKAIGLRWIYIMERVVGKTDEVNQRVQALIEEFQAQGKDTTELERWLEKYNEDMARAQEKLEKAKERLMELDTNWQVNRFLYMENKAMKSAFQYLKESHHKLMRIIKFIENQKTGSVELEGTGVLFAAGEGYARIEGDVKVLIFGNGTVTAPADSVVFATGFGDREENDGAVTYTGEGRILVKGEDITVTVEGNGLRIHAVGSGTVELNGTGVYKVKGFSIDTDGFVEDESAEEQVEQIEEIEEVEEA